MPRGWLPLLCLILLFWRPLNLAIELTTALPSLAMRGPVAIVELLFHAAVAAIAVAAVHAIWSRLPSAMLLARVALVGSAIAAVQGLNWSVLPHQTAPGESLPLSVLAVLHAGIWLAYLRRFSGRYPE